MTALQELKQLDYKAYKALGTELRSKVVLTLTKKARRPTDLGRDLDYMYGLWTHLNALVSVGIIRAHKVEPRRVLYRLNPTRLRELADQLTSLAQIAEDNEAAGLEMDEDSPDAAE